MKSFHLNNDLKIELFVNEPEVMSPVEMAFDENGRVFVAEMLDYPADPPPGKPARSRIRLLEDADSNGKVGRSTVFADNVMEVSGLMPWKGGLIVTSAPDILFMKDVDGDGKADIREVLYTGFPKVEPEFRITNPRLGVDNWIYCSNFGQDGHVTSPKHPERPPISVRGADFRFRLDRDLAEAASGAAQFGSTFDVWGNRFKCHLPRKQGGRVGPDLSGISNKTKEELLTNILNPSYAIEPQFTNYIVTTKDGGLHDGIIINETPGTVTLRGGSEQDETLLRKNIAEMRGSSISVMPDDLEKTLRRQDLADVISYLRGGL